MTYTFRPAVRENVGLLIALAGGTGSGKTFSALRIASGISGDKPFAVLDTENRRALHYASQFRFDHAEIRAPFRPDSYAEGIMAADAAGYRVIVVDSASHEHAGEGGLLDWHEEELERLAGTDWKKREACNMLAWAKVKTSHKQMMQKLLQVKTHVILCFRAEEKIEIAKVDGKTVIRPKQTMTGKDGWVPICEKNMPFEATCSFLLTADAPGIPKPIKLQEQHRPLFPLDSAITEESGRKIAEWATGEKPIESTPHSAASNGNTITESQAADLETLCRDNSLNIEHLLKAAKVPALTAILATDHARALQWIDKATAARER